MPINRLAYRFECNAGRASVATLGALLGGLLLSAASARAEPEHDQQTWAAVFTTGHLTAMHEDARFWLEGQSRFGSDTSRLTQGILRAGLGWALSEQWSVWVGYAWIPTDPPGGGNRTREHRPWQQMVGSGMLPVGRLGWLSRTRMEERFIEGSSEAGWRLRQFSKLTQPLTAGGRAYLSLWDEAFFALNDTDWGARAGVDQNRAFLGLGMKLATGVAAEVGYMNQYVFRSARADASNHILSLNLFLNLPAP